MKDKNQLLVKHRTDATKVNVVREWKTELRALTMIECTKILGASSMKCNYYRVNQSQTHKFIFWSAFLIAAKNPKGPKQEKNFATIDRSKCWNRFVKLKDKAKVKNNFHKKRYVGHDAPLKHNKQGIIRRFAVIHQSTERYSERKATSRTTKSTTLVHWKILLIS